MKCNAVVGGDNNDDNDDDPQPTRPSSRKNGLKAQTNIMSLNFIGKKSYYITKKGLSFLIHYKINSIKFSIKEKKYFLKRKRVQKAISVTARKTMLPPTTSLHLSNSI